MPGGQLVSSYQVVIPHSNTKGRQEDAEAIRPDEGRKLFFKIVQNTHSLTEILDLWFPECEILHLLLQISHLARLDFDFLDLNPLVTQALHHPFFLGWAQQHQCFTLGLVSGCSAHSVNVGIGIFWTIELNDPIYSGEIQSASSDVCTDQEGRFGGREFLENR